MLTRGNINSNKNRKPQTGRFDWLRKRRYGVFSWGALREAPVNDFRFKTPQSHEGWDGILYAQSTSKTCIQAQEGDGLLGRFAEIFITSAGLEWWWQERLITDGSFLLSYLPDLNLSPEQSEDCLYLNIIKPKKLENGSLPVLSLIHI